MCDFSSISKPITKDKNHLRQGIYLLMYEQYIMNECMNTIYYEWIYEHNILFPCVIFSLIITSDLFCGQSFGKFNICNKSENLIVNGKSSDPLKYLVF